MSSLSCNWSELTSSMAVFSPWIWFLSSLVAADYFTFLQHSGMFRNGCYTRLAAVAMAALFFIESLKGDGLKLKNKECSVINTVDWCDAAVVLNMRFLFNQTRRKPVGLSLCLKLFNLLMDNTQENTYCYCCPNVVVQFGYFHGNILMNV